MDSFEHEQCHLEDDSVLDGEPMECDQCWSDTIILPQLVDESCSCVRYTLYLFDQIVWQATQKAVAVINTTHNKSMDQSACRFL